MLGVAAERCGQGGELRRIPGYTGLHQAQAATPQCGGRPARWGKITRGTENQGGADDRENSSVTPEAGGSVKCSEISGVWPVLRYQTLLRESPDLTLKTSEASSEPNILGCQKVRSGFL